MTRQCPQLYIVPPTRLNEADMRPFLPIFLLAIRISTYWYPNSYTRTPSADEDCYSQAYDPYSITCHATNDFAYAPCSDLFIPSTPSRPNNFTYYAICSFPDPYEHDEEDFWLEIITVDVCENYWDACISDNVLAKYDDTIEYGAKECKKVTDRACKDHEDDEFSVPGSEQEDTTFGAFDLGPYSTVSQVTVPRISMGSEMASGISGSTRVLWTSTTAVSQLASPTVVSSAATASRASLQSPSPTTIAQVTEVSMAGKRMNEESYVMASSVAGALLWCVLMT